VVVFIVGISLKIDRRRLTADRRVDRSILSSESVLKGAIAVY
jgi:hypothetical protein